MLKSGFPICNRNAIYFSFRFLFCFVFVRFIYSFLGGGGEGVGNMTELFSGISRKTRTLGTTGFSRLRREFSVLAEGRHVFGRRPKPRAAKLFARVTIKTWQKPETAPEKSLAPRVENTRTVLQMFLSDYALIVKSEIRIANPNPDFLCMCCTCSARAI